MNKNKEITYLAFIDLENACGRVHREVLWQGMEVYGMGKRALSGIKYSIKK